MTMTRGACAVCGADVGMGQEWKTWAHVKTEGGKRLVCLDPRIYAHKACLDAHPGFEPPPRGPEAVWLELKVGAP